MFKRRKPDDPEATDVTTMPSPPARPEDIKPPSRPADDGLGVPPFRPALVPTLPTTQASATTKDDPMARSPFSTTPTPTPQTPPAPSAGIPPAPQPSPMTMNRPPASPSGMGARPSGAREPGERRTLVVGRGISVQGSVQDAELLVVEGTVEANNIHATGLAINSGGVFKGEVEVEDAEIAGTIDGTLTVRGSLIVRASGRVLGTARCRRLQVEDGGQITGRIEMLTDSTQDAPFRAPGGSSIEAPRPPESSLS